MEMRKKIEKATVKLPETRGLGVIVPDGLILTAAHCVELKKKNIIKIALGDTLLMSVDCCGQQIKAEVYAIEPVADIAVLGMPYNYKLSQDYEKIINMIEPVKLKTDEIELGKEYPAMVFTHKGEWLQGKVEKGNDNVPQILLEGAEIEQGTSGGPVIDQEGTLLGVVSNGDMKSFQIAYPLNALPVWVLKRIAE